MADITPIVSLNGELAMPEKVWMQGPPGPQGQQGEPGAAATVTVGTVTTGEPGTDAIITNSGTESAAVLNFTIPRGATGAAGAAGADGVSPTVSTSKSGNVTTITIVDASGTKTATINDGAKGDTGPAGPAGAGVPDGGTVGQLLGKTETGTAWIDPPQSGVQPDWNQNDETAADFVKNRPFYTGNPVETVLVEESTLAFNDNGNGIYIVESPTTLKVTVGAPYKVYWDGTVYECTCVDFSGGTVIGNLSIIGSGSDTGEPFLISVYDVGIEIYTADASASHTFSVSGFVSEVVKIDEKYIPNIPADKFPATPVIELAHNISDYIASATQPSFFVSNLSYSEIYSIVEKGSFQIKDPSCVYVPIKHHIDSSGNIFVDILISGSPMTYAQLVCNVDQRKFLRNRWWQIEATQK